jgi:ADP-heptose:LPS heptosyltransferase
MKPFPSDPPKKILVIRLKAIGDVLLATPVVRALRKAHPSSTLHFLTHAVAEPLIRHDPRLDRVIVHPRKDGPLGERLRFFRDLRAERYDLVLDLESTPRSAVLTFVTGAPVRVGHAFRVREWAFTHPVPRNRVRKYQAEVCLDLVRAMGASTDGPGTEIFLTEAEREWAMAKASEGGLLSQARRIGLNPTGSWSAKRWPKGNWRGMIALLHDSFRSKPVLFWGPGDEGRVRDITAGLEGKCLVMPRTGLREAAAYLSRLELLIGTDGTPQHLAQALGVPTLTLFGPSWAIGYTPPVGPHKALQRFLDCGPCDHTTCPHPPKGQGPGHYERECLDLLTPRKVLQAARSLLTPGT